MVKSFIFLDMDYRTVHTYANDPTLDAIYRYFTDKGERLETIRWDHAKPMRGHNGSSFDLEACLKWNDFSHVAESDCFIALNSDGRYHNRTCPVIHAADSSRNDEFSVVIIDAHPDYGVPFNNSVHSADFVGRIDRMENVRKIFLLGVTPYGLATSIPEWRTDYKVLDSPKVEIYLSDDLETLLRPETAADAEEHHRLRSAYEIINRSNSCRMLSDFDTSTIPTSHVYLSTDTDAVGDFSTIWKGLGKMRFPELMGITGDIADERDVFGADVCGYRFNPDDAASVKDLERLYAYHKLLKSKMTPWKPDMKPMMSIIDLHTPASNIKITA